MLNNSLYGFWTFSQQSIDKKHISQPQILENNTQNDIKDLETKIISDRKIENEKNDVLSVENTGLQEIPEKNKIPFEISEENQLPTRISYSFEDKHEAYKEFYKYDDFTKIEHKTKLSSDSL